MQYHTHPSGIAFWQTMFKGTPPFSQKGIIREEEGSGMEIG